MSDEGTTDKKSSSFSTPIAIVIAGVLVAGAVLGKDYLFKKSSSGGQPEVSGVQKQNEAPGEPTQSIVPPSFSENDPVKGDVNAPVTIIEFSDYLCPFCAAAAGFREQDVQASLKSRDPGWAAPVPLIIKEYVDTGKVKLVFKGLPFHGEPAFKLAKAALCAKDQGKYWEMHDAIFANQVELAGDPPKMTASDLAVKIGLDTKKFEECFNSDKYDSQINADAEMASKAKVDGTPSYFINGQSLVGAQPFSAFKEIIERELLSVK